MDPLSADDVLRVWELGQGKPSWQQALLLLSSAFPSVRMGDLATLTLGQRNFYLFALRARTFGSVLKAGLRCVRCRETIEFDVSVDDLCPFEEARQPAADYLITVEGIDVRFRPLDSRDLAAAAGCPDVVTARQALFRRCVLEARQGSQPVVASDLAESVLMAVGSHLSAIDEPGDLPIGLKCPVCQHEWAERFDIASFFWIELAGEARRLLADVNVLARTYGWREADILAMSSARRKAYLDLVGD